LKTRSNPIKIKKRKKLRGLLILIWAGFSILIYGIFCLFIRIFSIKVAAKIAYWWLWNISVFGGCKVKVYNLEKLDKDVQYIFLANHQSVYDIIALVLVLPFQLSFIAKKSLFSIPFFGWCLTATGHIAIDRSNPHNAKKSINKACKFINEKKRSIFAFPEGTRSESGQMGDFKLGIFSLALLTGLDIVPVTINGSRNILPKNFSFIQPGTAEIILHEPINIKEYGKTTKVELAKRTRDIIQKDLVVD